MSKQHKLAVILGVIFISFNLRAPITAVGSVVGLIKDDYSITNGMAGFITTLPLIAFAVVSPFVARISKKIGYGKTMSMGLVFIVIGEVIRSFTGVVGLYAGTAVLGVGIAIGNVLIPGVIKLKFPGKIGAMTSVYTTCMCLFAAVGAGVSLPLADGLGLGWKLSLASWVILGLFTMAIWAPQNKEKPIGANMMDNPKDPSEVRPIWKCKLAWWVTLYMGVQSLVFYSFVAWLPSMVIDKGFVGSFAATVALTYQLVAIPATLVVPHLTDIRKDQKLLSKAVAAVYIVGVAMFMFTNTKIAVLVAVVLMALGMGGSISLAISFISHRSPNAVRTSELSGMSQSAGYILAAIGPSLLGIVYDMTSSFTIPLGILVALLVVLFFCGNYAGADKVVEEH